MSTINLRPSLPDSATPAQLQEIRERLVLVSPEPNNAAVAGPDGGVFVPLSTAQSAGNLRAPQVAGNLRGTAPVPADLGLTAFVENTEILRSTAIGIEQRFLVNAAGTAVLDREFPPDDTRPLTTVPSVLAGTGWIVGDTFVLYDSANDSYDKYRVETMGPVQVARKKNFGGTSSGGSGGATNLSNTPGPTGIQIASSTGTGTTLPIATGINAGLLPPRHIHPNSPAATLPATSNLIGEEFIRTGAVAPGRYISEDLVGNWRRL